MGLPAIKSSFVMRWVRKAIVMAVVTVAFGYFYAWASPRAFPLFPVPGFGRGMLHGALMPIALPSLLLGKNVPIYAAINAGRLYKIGYIVGINICGLLFFGPLFWRPGQAGKDSKETSSQKSQ
jgi:hypothetical protein